MRLIESFGEAFEHWTVTPSLVIDLGKDRFVVLGHFQMPGSASGLELEREWAQVLTLRGACVAHERELFDWEKGLRAAGLDPTRLDLERLRRKG